MTVSVSSFSIPKVLLLSNNNGTCFFSWNAWDLRTSQFYRGEPPPVFDFKPWKYHRYVSVYPYRCPASVNCREVSAEFILILFFLANPRESPYVTQFLFLKYYVFNPLSVSVLSNSNWGLDTAI